MPGWEGITGTDGPLVTGELCGGFGRRSDLEGLSGKAVVTLQSELALFGSKPSSRTPSEAQHLDLWGRGTL